MAFRSIADYLAEHPFFAGLDAASVQELAGCARNEHFRAGEYLFREGATAEHFYVIMRGRVALELSTANSGPHMLESAGEGEVLDWPWLVPPHRWLFDARAVEPTSVVSLESACLRGKHDANPRLGYEFTQRVAQVMSYRLMATRVRLLDIYGAPEPAGAGPLVGEPTEASPVSPASPDGPASQASPEGPATPRG
jgi:CRP/FNR family transcriptional regulator, cyclic AMP receptor protein